MNPDGRWDRCVRSADPCTTVAARSTGRPVSSRVCSAISRAGIAWLGFGTTMRSWAGARAVTASAYDPWVWPQEADGSGLNASGVQTGTPDAAHRRRNSARACSAARSRASASRSSCFSASRAAAARPELGGSYST